MVQLVFAGVYAKECMTVQAGNGDGESFGEARKDRPLGPCFLIIASVVPTLSAIVRANPRWLEPRWAAWPRGRNEAKSGALSPGAMGCWWLVYAATAALLRSDRAVISPRG